MAVFCHCWATCLRNVGFQCFLYGQNPNQDLAVESREEEEEEEVKTWADVGTAHLPLVVAMVTANQLSHKADSCGFVND